MSTRRENISTRQENMSGRDNYCAAQVKAVLQEHVQAALAALRVRKRPTDESVHTARKRLKRARAALRLLRPVVGEAAYRRENVALRDVARPLSPVRDAAVMEATLDDLLQELSEPDLLAPLREEFRRQGRDARQYGLDRARMSRILEALEASQQRIDTWQVEDADPALLIDAIERLYRKGRGALAQAKDERSPEALHEARKQAKYLELALAPFRQDASAETNDPIASVVDRAESIEDDLGADHDLAVLRERIENLLHEREADGEPLLAAIDQRQRRLRAKALKQARKLYKKKPSRFRHDLQSGLAAAEPASA